MFEVQGIIIPITQSCQLMRGVPKNVMVLGGHPLSPFAMDPSKYVGQKILDKTHKKYWNYCCILQVTGPD